MSSPAPLPGHYARTVRAFVRLGLAGIAAGMILGIWWTEVRQTIAYTPGAPSQVERKGSRVRLELPPGYHFEAGLKLKLSHGHSTLILGVLPLCFALCLTLAHSLGGPPLSPGMLRAAFWCYAVGAVGTVGIMIYRGAASLAAIRAGNFDYQAVQQDLFAGSRALKGALYGTTHSLLAVGAGILIYGLWRAMRPPEPTA
ncbi:MAG: hypothetical protein D6731_12005 [Planctomycetota bacterium]|nr:MAG: hypothetical protein D6731_12005 [Planctomycetota bacterium]